MKIILLVLALALVSRNPCYGVAQSWLDESKALMEAAVNSPSKENVLALTQRLKSMGTTDPNEAQLYQEIQSLLLATPGHAKYHQERLDDMRNAIRNEPDVNIKRGLYYDDKLLEDHGRTPFGYDHQQAVAGLESLAKLPSPESVAVLGHFLEDPEGRDGKSIIEETEDEGRLSPYISYNAANILEKIGIEHPPSPYKTSWGKVDAWKEWWGDVKSGKRTYRFAGSDIEYGPNGPVAAKSDRRKTGSGVNQDVADSVSQGSRPLSSKPPVAMYGISIGYWLAGVAVLLAAIGLWKVLKTSRT